MRQTRLSIDQTPWADSPEGYDRLIFDELDSTNAQAARIAADLDRPTWILAHHQTAARGRQGRAWANPVGNLAATLVMRPDGPLSDVALRSFLAANALYEALLPYAGAEKLALKWPNDVLLSGGKVAGILLESAGTATGVDWLAIGIGVNLVHAPDTVADAAFPPVSLRESTGDTVDATEFLTALAHAYAKQEAKFLSRGFAPIRDEWLTRAARLGETITARSSRSETTGIFDTVDDTGNLILRSNAGPVSIAAADVFFSSQAPDA